MNLQQAYLRNRVETSTPADLVVMLYDGLARFARQAAERLREGGPGGKTAAADAVIRCTNILTELNTSLDFRVDPEFCQRMSALYAFFVERLTTGLRDNDPARIEDIVPFIEDLRDAWRDASSFLQTPEGQAALAQVG